jgi:DNA-binding transcriptional LysR family regulator
VIEDFLVAIRAITLGQGIALLPRILVQDLIDQGELALFSDVLLPVDHTYHLAHTAASVRRQHVQTVVDWLRASLAHLN